MLESHPRLLPFSEAAICRAVADHRERRRKMIAPVDRPQWISVITAAFFWIIRILIFVFMVLWPWESAE